MLCMVHSIKLTLMHTGSRVAFSQWSTHHWPPRRVYTQYTGSSPWSYHHTGHNYNWCGNVCIVMRISGPLTCHRDCERWHHMACCVEPEGCYTVNRSQFGDSNNAPEIPARSIPLRTGRDLFIIAKSWKKRDASSAETPVSLEMVSKRTDTGSTRRSSKKKLTYKTTSPSYFADRCADITYKKEVTFYVTSLFLRCRRI